MYVQLRDAISGALNTSVIMRQSDGAFIPADPANTDWQAYQAWLNAGNTPAEVDGTAGQHTDRDRGLLSDRQKDGASES